MMRVVVWVVCMRIVRRCSRVLVGQRRMRRQAMRMRCRRTGEVLHPRRSTISRRRRSIQREPGRRRAEGGVSVRMRM